MKDNTKRDNPIINMLLKIKSSYLLLITKIKSLFQKQNSNNKNITIEVEGDQQHKSLGSESVTLSPADEEPQVNYDVADKLEAKNEIEEDEFFDAIANPIT